jgi:hypothetical protein
VGCATRLSESLRRISRKQPMCCVNGCATHLCGSSRLYIILARWVWIAASSCLWMHWIWSSFGDVAARSNSTWSITID